MSPRALARRDRYRTASSAGTLAAWACLPLTCALGEPGSLERRAWIAAYETAQAIREGTDCYAIATVTP